MWSTQMVMMLRYYINDLCDPPTYNNERLKEALLVAALQVTNEVDLIYNYNVDLDALSITPDPTLSNPKDENMMLLVGYKAAAIITMSEFKTASSKGLIVKDGSSMVDMREVANQKLAAAKFYLDGYEDARWLYNVAVRNPGVGILGPVTIVSQNYMSAGIGGTGAGYGNSYYTRDNPSL